jgi:hypothetical protein
MAKNKKDVILVPWDYTEASKVALMHAIQLAAEVNNHIMLARFIESPGFFAGKKVKESLHNAEFEKLKIAGQEIMAEYNVNPYLAVEVGITAGNVKDLVKDANANLVVCGKTYKLNEKITFEVGSVAKMFCVIDIPFIVAQEKPAHNYYKEIVVPLDHDKKYKETLQWVVYLSKYYNCNINIIKPYIEDEFMKKDMTNNIYFTKKMLDKKNIIYGIKTAKKNKKFDDEILRFAENIDADLIVIMAKKYRNLVKEKPHYEERIPFLVINRSSKLMKYGGFR